MAEMTIEQVTDKVLDHIVKDPAALDKFSRSVPIDKLMDTESGKAWQARAINDKIGEVQTKLNAEIELRTAAEKDAAELLGKLQRREQYERSYGVHRDHNGRLRSNISPEAEKYLSEFARAYLKGGMPAVRAMSTGSAGGGAEFIQTDVAAEVLRLVPETSLVTRVGRNWPMTTTKQDIGSMLTRAQAYWPGEGVAATPTYPTSGKCHLEAKELVSYTELSQALFEDATIPIGQTMSDMLVESVGVELDRVALVGKSVADGGSDAHTGALWADGINVLSMNKGETSFQHLNWTHFSRLTVAPPEGGTDDCSYIINPTTLNWAMTATDKNGQPIWNSPREGSPGTICGRPYYTSYRMPGFPAADSEGNYPASPSTRLALYGNWGKFLFYGLRRQLAVAMSETAGDNFKNRTIGILAYTRGGVAAFGPAIAALATAPK
jgi:HK97 family phage major capsid protein